MSGLELNSISKCCNAIACSNPVNATGNGVQHDYILEKHSYKDHLPIMLYLLNYLGYTDAFPIILIIVWSVNWEKGDTT